jgi:hypothetical protein
MYQSGSIQAIANDFRALRVRNIAHTRAEPPEREIVKSIDLALGVSVRRLPR